MKSYEELVKSAFSEKKEYLISNSSKEHALILIKELFNSAKENIKIYTGGTDISFYQKKEIQESLKNKKDVKFEIILDNNSNLSAFKEVFPAEGTEFFVIKKEHGIKEIELPFDKIDNFDKLKHFAVIDDCAFRAEYPHQSKEENIKAIASANNKIMVTFLENIFKILKETRCQKAA